MPPRILLRPGQQLKEYEIFRKSPKTDEKGKTSYSVEPVAIGSLRGSLTAIKQSEVERWKQQGHNVTHKIVVHGRTIVRAEDVLQRGSRKYYVHAQEDRASLGMFTTVYCEYRPGVGKHGHKPGESGNTADHTGDSAADRDAVTSENL